MSYINIVAIEDKSNLFFINDSQRLYDFGANNNTNNKPPLMEKKYDSFYEFILTTGEKKALIYDNTLNEGHINNITNNNKGLLKKAFISNSCTTISANTFKDCSNLTLVSYINTNDISLTNIETSAFDGCNSLDECKLFDISNNITTIGNSTFKNCNKLYQIKLETTNIQSIGANAFENCQYLLTLRFPLSLNNIGNEAFKGSGLVNIFFNSILPTTLGNNIFSSIPENACCYYKSSNISGTNYNNLKNLFTNNGANVVFIENSSVNNNINNNIENDSSFYTINNTNVSANVVTQTKNILDSIIKKRNDNVTYTINIDYDNDLVGGSTLGYADWSNGEIRLNPDNDSGSQVNFNGVSTILNVVVLVHEILHIFGYGVGTIWDSLNGTNPDTDYFFYGKNGTFQYNKYLELYNFNNKLHHVKVEDSGGGGTVGSHIEEGYNLIIDPNSDFSQWILQARFDLSQNLYPCFYEEIMTGWIDNNNYFTWISCGVLQDLGFSVNYNSEYVYYNNDLYSYPDLKLINRTILPYNYMNNNTSILNDISNNSLKCKCNCSNNKFTIKNLSKKTNN